MRWPFALWPRTYFPGHAQNRMRSEGDLKRAHIEYFEHKCENLRFLLKNRYGWMNSFIKPGDTIVEIGAGAGLSREFIVEEIILTDVLPFPWMNVCGDALRLPFGIEKIDALICANVMHHVAAPVSFIAEMHRCLKPGGHVLIVEPNPSFLFLLALRIKRHEEWTVNIMFSIWPQGE